MNLIASDSPDRENPASGDGYQVVALRYRPQAFEDLVGQGHIATALSNAIKQSRVGHAYLFTGARGVGKTSSARIFAKCLNCEKGPTITPCNACDICAAVSTGEDVDVLEIDGASNRGIDEIRQLRSNAAIRPSRGRFKIYIIDEVHMLTQQAFNALLKTLEEPPGHVKFIFCTTDPQKIPITVLSRCQRFDFSPVQPNEIAGRLNEIATNEGVTADEQALALLARRANGSMRDSQSLLEQLFSFCDKTISVEEVHQLLGTSDIARIAEIAAAMAAKDSSATLRLIHQTISEGSDAGQIAEQLLGYFRDMMAIRVGCDENTLLSCSPSDMDGLQTLADQLGLETILSCVQVLDQAMVRMQSSLHARTLLEVAAVRVCNLEHLDSVGDLIKQLSSNDGTVTAKRPAAGGSSSGSSLKKNDVAERATPESVISKPTTTATPRPASHASAPSGSAALAATAATASAVTMTTDKSSKQPTATLPKPVPTMAPANAEHDNRSAPAKGHEPAASDSTNTRDIEKSWKQALSVLDAAGDLTGDMASQYERLEWKAPDQLVVTMSDAYNREQCSRQDRRERLESALATAAGRSIRLDFVTSAAATKSAVPVPRMTRTQQIRELQQHDYVRQTMDLFDAEVTDFYKR
jgi:DNA polymerase-3 subunit gamma/tau